MSQIQKKNMDETDKALLGTQENNKINLNFPGLSLFVRRWVRHIIVHSPVYLDCKDLIAISLEKIVAQDMVFGRKSIVLNIPMHR